MSRVIRLVRRHYTSSSLSSLLIFTKSFSCSFSYKKFCFSSSSVGVVGDWLRDGAGDGPLIESVGNAASSNLGVFTALLGGLYDVDGSLWHSTSSIFSRGGELRASSLSQILFDGFSEKRRCWLMTNLVHHDILEKFKNSHFDCPMECFRRSSPSGTEHSANRSVGWTRWSRSRDPPTTRKSPSWS